MRIFTPVAVVTSVLLVGCLMLAVATPSTLSDASSLNTEHEEAQLQASGQPQRPQGSYAAVALPRRRKREANIAVPHQQVQVPDTTSPPPQRRKREPNTVTSHQQVLEMEGSDAATAGPQQRRKRESNPAPRQVIAEEGSDEATPPPQRRKRESNTAVTPPNKILAVVVPVYPGHVDQLFSAIEQRALSCPVGAMSNADLVLYYPDGGSDSSFRRVVYAVAGSIGRCFATIRTVRTLLGEEEEAGTTDEILSAMFYSLFLDEEVRLQLSRYESFAVMNWQDLNKDASVLVNLYGAASSTDSGAFWVKSTIVAGSDNGSEPGNGIGGSGAGNGIGGGGVGTGVGSTRAGNGIGGSGEGNGVGGSGAGNGFGDSGEGNGIDASGASNGIHGSGAGTDIGKTSAAVDRSSSSSRSHAVYNNNDPVFAEYVGLTYERWALSRPYQMALRLTLSEAGHLPYSDMFVDFDTQGLTSGNADVYGDGDSSESISYDHDLLFGTGMTGVTENSKSVDWEFRNNNRGVLVSRNLQASQKSSAPDAQGSAQGDADDYDDGDSSEYSSDDHDFFYYNSGVTGMIEKSKSTDQEEFRHTQSGVVDHADNSAADSSDADSSDADSSDDDSSESVSNKRDYSYSSGNPGVLGHSKSADQEFRNTIADVFDRADSTADDFYEYVSDDHGLLLDNRMTALIENQKSVYPEFRDRNVGVVGVSQDLRVLQQSPDPLARGLTSSNDADDYADNDSSKYVSDDHDFLYSSGMPGAVANAKSVDRKFRSNDSGVRVSRNLRAFQQSPSPDTQGSSPDNEADDHSDSDSFESIADDHGLFYSNEVPGIVENSKSVDREIRNNNNNNNNNVDVFDHADFSDADFSEYISDDRSVLYSSGSMAGVAGDSKSVDWEFRNNDRGVRVSRNLRGFQGKVGRVPR